MDKSGTGKRRGSMIIAVPMVVAGSFLIATHGDPHALAIHPLALISGLISAICSALYITMPAPLIRKHGTMPVVGWGLFLGGCFLALFLYGASITGPVRAGVYNLFEPVVAVAASALLLGQAFHITELAGIAAILTGIAILTMAKGGTYPDKTTENN